MPTHPFSPIAGSISTFELSSDCLLENRLGDPGVREVAVYLPPGHQRDGTTPLLVDLVGFTGSGRAHLNWKAFGESVPHRHERLVKEGKMGPCVFAFPDCFTSLGGNQYIDSSAMGRWGSYLTEVLLPEVEERYGTRPGREGRGVFGKSSGGYGALVHGMRYSEHWGAVACHSGDMGFDRLFLGELPYALTRLAERGGVEGFLTALNGAAKVAPDDLRCLIVLAMAATYDPCPAGYKGIRLPVDLRTCELIPERWSAWLAHDPVVMLEEAEAQAGLRALGGLFIDCGSRDQFNIHYGTRQLTGRLEALEISHVYEEFEDTHSDIDYRMDSSLPFLFEALS